MPKTNSAIRTLSIPAWLSNEIARHIGHLAQDAGFGLLIFTTDTGGLRCYSNWRHRIWEPACRKAEVQGLDFHDLRRTNATAMVAAGIDLKTAQHRLGHSDPRMTLGLYAQATTTADEQAAETLGQAFRKSDVGQMWTRR